VSHELELGRKLRCDLRKNFSSDLSEIWYVCRGCHNNNWLAGGVDRQSCIGLIFILKFILILFMLHILFFFDIILLFFKPGQGTGYFKNYYYCYYYYYYCCCCYFVFCVINYLCFCALSVIYVEVCLQYWSVQEIVDKFLYLPLK